MNVDEKKWYAYRLACDVECYKLSPLLNSIVMCWVLGLRKTQSDLEEKDIDLDIGMMEKFLSDREGEKNE